MRAIPDDVQFFLAELASEMTAATFDKNEVRIRQLYQELKLYYEDLKSKGSLHPAVVETLADYTENKQDAVDLYQEALAESQPDEPQYMILISMSEALAELGKNEAAKTCALRAFDQAREQEDYYYIKEAERVMKLLSE